MSLAAALKHTLEKTPGIERMAFGDLSSGLVLMSEGRTACPREVLDLVSERSSSGFALLIGTPLPEAVSAEAFGTCVIHFTERSAEVHARAPAAPNDVVSAVCSPGTPLLPAVRAGLGLACRLADST